MVTPPSEDLLTGSEEDSAIAIPSAQVENLQNELDELHKQLRRELLAKDRRFGMRIQHGVAFVMPTGGAASSSFAGGGSSCSSAFHVCLPHLPATSSAGDICGASASSR